MTSASTPGLAVAEFSDDGPKLVRWHRKTRSRDKIVTWIKEVLHPEQPPTIIGMDFSFGFPVGTMRLVFQASSWIEMAAIIGKLVNTQGLARGVAEAINARPEYAGEGPFRTNATRNAFRIHVDTRSFLSWPHRRDRRLKAPAAPDLLRTRADKGEAKHAGDHADDDCVKNCFH